MEALKKIGIDWRDRRLIANLYMGQTFRVRINGESSEKGIIGRGTRQGCPLSPLLFNIYIQEIMNKAMEKSEDGVKVNGNLINAIRFADDQAMMDETQKGLQRIMNTLVDTSEEYDMKINTKKTKVMHITKGKVKQMKITVNGVILEQVKEFKYLGSLITEDARCHQEIKQRIAMGKQALVKRGELLRGGLNRGLKKRMVKVLIWSIVLYGAETWTLRKEDIKALEAFEMWVWRRIENISWTEHITNEEVLKRVGECRLIITTIRKRQHRWLGHIMRGDSLVITVLEGRLKGRKQKGRPRKMLMQWLMEECKTTYTKVNGYKRLKEKAQDRTAWRSYQRTCFQQIT